MRRVALFTPILWLLMGTAANATFPGANGRIAAVYTISTPSDCGDQGHHFDCETDQSRIAELPPSGGRATTVFSCPNCRPTKPSWSPDGRRFVYSVAGTMYVASANGSASHAIGPGFVPSFSPDGAQIVFVGQDDALERMPAAGGRPQVISDLGTDPYDGPAWCGSGEIAFMTGGRLLLVRSDGTNLQPVTGPNVTSVDCSPAGGRLVYQLNGSTYVSRLDGTRRRMVVPGPTNGVSFSPDGRSIVFAPGHDLWVLPVDGHTGAKQVTGRHHAGDFSLPSWQPRPRR